MGKTSLRRKPLVELCLQQNWEPRHLQQPPGDGQTPEDLLSLELQLICAEGDPALADALVAAARRQGVKPARLKGMASSDEAKPKASPPDPLTVLRRVCARAGVTPVMLKESLKEGLEQALAKEMQIARQQGQHQLVVMLGRKAGKLGLAHPRIEINYRRSERLLHRDHVMREVETLLAGKRSAKERAEQLMLEAITDDPDFRLCRLQLEARLRERLGRPADPFSEELLDHRVGLEINRRRLALLEERLSPSVPEPVGGADQEAGSAPGTSEQTG